MELVLLSDALHRSAANSVSAIIPYFGYARQDRRSNQQRTPISARVVADIICHVAKVKQIVTVDIHSLQIQGFFTGIPMINLNAGTLIHADIWKRYIDNVTIVAPDAGGVERARCIARELETDLAVIDKRRPRANVSEIMNVLGDVRDRNCIIIDDLVDTAGTLCNAVEALKLRGAKTVSAYCTHAVLSGPAIERIENSSMDMLVVTDTIPLQPEGKKCKKIHVISMASMLAEVIRRIHTSEPVSSIVL